MKITNWNFTPLWAALLCVVLLWSCDLQDHVTLKPQSQPDLNPDEIKRLILLDTNYLYSLEAATKDATEVAAQLDREDADKGKIVKRSIQEVFSYAIPDTLRGKSLHQKKEPGIYVFNFSDKNGFAMLSSDERALGRLAWAATGTIDKDINPGVRLFISRAAEYVQYKRGEVETMRGDDAHISLLKKLKLIPNDDQLKKANNGRIAANTPCPISVQSALPCGSNCNLQTTTIQTSSSIVQTTLVAPILHTNWDQSPPFNNYFSSGCSYKKSYCSYSNSNYYAGCVPVSEAQVVALYRARYNYQNDPDWNVIANTSNICNLNSTQIDKMAFLIKDIYNQYSITAKSCSSGTFVFDQSIIGLTHDEGISSKYGFVQGDWTDYTKANLVNSLQNNSPVPVHGSQHEWCALFSWICSPDPTVMHQWVMDGLLTTNQISTYAVYPVDYDNCVPLPSYGYSTNSVVNTYVHNNWGWGGDQDGWYIEGAFGGQDLTKNFNIYSFNHFDKIIAYVTHN